MTRRLQKRFVPATLLVLMMSSGCATKEGYRNVVDAWLGQPETALVSAWGPPQRRYDLELLSSLDSPQQRYETEKSKVLIYYYQRDVFIPGPTRSYQRYFDDTGTMFSRAIGREPDQTVTYSCETSFEVINDIVVSWSFGGNDCVAKHER